MKQLLEERVNKTQLDIEKATDRGLIHRDYAAHFFRWSFALRYCKYKCSVLDVGCGNGMLAQTLYVNKYKPSLYLGVDIRGHMDLELKSRKLNFPAMFERVDVRKEKISVQDDTFDIVISFEMLEHFHKEYVPNALKEMKRCMKKDGVTLISTPNFDGNKAGNHINEYTEKELEQMILDSGFKIDKKFGTFASQKTLYPVLTDDEKKIYDKLKGYYDSNVISVLFAPLYPSQSRNILWVLRK